MCIREKTTAPCSPVCTMCVGGTRTTVDRPGEHKLHVPNTWPLDEDLGILCNWYQIQIQGKPPTQLITPGSQSQDFPFAPQAEGQTWAASNSGSFLAASRILPNSASPILAAPSLSHHHQPSFCLWIHEQPSQAEGAGGLVRAF